VSDEDQMAVEATGQVQIRSVSYCFQRGRSIVLAWVSFLLLL
jgi:hypothetical protein